MDRDNDNAALPALDRILDRKIESKALPASFSSNLGRKAPVGEKGGKVKSVRSIVDWLEKTGASGPDGLNSNTQAPHRKSEKADKVSLVSKATTRTTTTIKPDYLQPSGPHPSTPTRSRVVPPKSPPTHPEEYSLTLLKYKSYFNNRALGRCLDDEDGTASSGAMPTMNAASTSSCYSIQNPDIVMASLNDMRKQLEPGSSASLGRARSQRETQPGGSGTDHTDNQVEDGSIYDISGATAVVETDNARRDPTEVRAF